MTKKRFRKGKSILTDFPTGAIIDEETGKRYYDGIKPSYISSRELVKILNELYNENEELKHECNYLQNRLDDFINIQNENEQLKKENERLMKMLDNVANYMQREHREIPLDDFVEWWNNIAIEGLEDDNGVNENKIRKRKVKADGRVDYVGISKEDLE